MKPSIPPVLIIFGLVCFALVQNTQAVSPPPDGGYPGGNTAEGQNALLSLTSGTYNTAVGLFSLQSNTVGRFNTAIGAGALLANIASDNTATGTDALYRNTTGFRNNANGAFALFSNTGGSYNTADGYQALYSNTTGDSNTANGTQALFSNTTGYQNTANGGIALFYNTTGIWNTATGLAALHNNTTGIENTAVGATALYGNYTGGANTAVGFSAGFSGGGGGNTAVGVQALFGDTGSGNTAVGITAMFSPHTGNNNTAIGAGALYNAYLGDDNIALGNGAGSNLRTGDNNIYIYDPGIDGESNTIRIGTVGTQTATFIAGISGTAVTGAAVVVNSSGQLGVAASSARFKDEIKPMNEASEAILALKPVTFRYKPEIDAKRAPQFGLVAEDVAKVNPDLVARDREGKPFTVRYEAVNAMLLNEFLKEHRKNEEQQATIAQLKSGMEALTATVREQAAQIHKVSAQLEASNPAQQVVNNP
jgi:methyl-accepting chemotaxis protein